MPEKIPEKIFVLLSENAELKEKLGLLVDEVETWAEGYSTLVEAISIIASGPHSDCPRCPACIAGAARDEAFRLIERAPSCHTPEVEEIIKTYRGRSSGTSESAEVP